MLVAKRMIGWICFLSFAAAVACGGWLVYLRVAPFFHGAIRYCYDWPWPEEMVKKLARNGLDRSDSGALRELVTRDARRWSAASGWYAFDAAWEPYMVSKTPHYLAGAALLNERGAIVAAYPEGLTVWMPPLKDANWGDWKSRLRVACAPQAGASELAVALYIIRRANGEVSVARSGEYNDKPAAGEVIGRMVLVTKRNWVFVYAPPGARFVGEATAWTYGILSVVGFAAFWFLLPIWAGMDAGYRGMRPTAWGLLVLVTNWIGLLAYLIARLPPPKPCPNCGERVLAKYRRCPACGVLLLTRCPVCRTKMKPGWQFCPVCNAIPFKSSDQAPTPQPLPIAAEPAEQPSLSVTVRDAESGVPIANAAVLVRGPSPLQGLTNRAGVFEARKLDAGSYTVEASREGHDAARAEVEAAPDSSRSIALDLKALPGVISGKVTDHAGRPLAGAHVYLDSNRLDRSVLTDPGGRFALVEIPAGPYAVKVDGEGYESQTRIAELVPGQAAALDFTLNPTESRE